MTFNVKRYCSFYNFYVFFDRFYSFILFCSRSVSSSFYIGIQCAYCLTLWWSFPSLRARAREAFCCKSKCVYAIIQWRRWAFFFICILYIAICPYCIRLSACLLARFVPVSFSLHSVLFLFNISIFVLLFFHFFFFSNRYAYYVYMIL